MPRLQSITIQCLEALQFLHGLGLIHCDLKPENILVNSYSRCERKVIDLGSSTDVWSLGCILAGLCTGNVLFQNDSLASLLSRVMGIIGSIDHEMLTKGRDSHKYFKEIDCDGSGPRLINDEEALLIGSYLDVPTGQEISSSGRDSHKYFKGNYMGSTRLRTEDLVDTTSVNWKECSVKTTGWLSEVLPYSFHMDSSWDMLSVSVVQQISQNGPTEFLESEQFAYSTIELCLGYLFKILNRHDETSPDDDTPLFISIKTFLARFELKFRLKSAPLALLLCGYNCIRQVHSDAYLPKALEIVKSTNEFLLKLSRTSPQESKTDAINLAAAADSDFHLRAIFGARLHMVGDLTKDCINGIHLLVHKGSGLRKLLQLELAFCLEQLFSLAKLAYEFDCPGDETDTNSICIAMLKSCPISIAAVVKDSNMQVQATALQVLKSLVQRYVEALQLDYCGEISGDSHIVSEDSQISVVAAMRQQWYVIVSLYRNSKLPRVLGLVCDDALGLRLSQRMVGWDMQRMVGWNLLALWMKLDGVEAVKDVSGVEMYYSFHLISGIFLGLCAGVCAGAWLVSRRGRRRGNDTTAPPEATPPPPPPNANATTCAAPPRHDADSIVAQNDEVAQNAGMNGPCKTRKRKAKRKATAQGKDKAPEADANAITPTPTTATPTTADDPLAEPYSANELIPGIKSVETRKGKKGRGNHKVVAQGEAPNVECTGRSLGDVLEYTLWGMPIQLKKMVCVSSPSSISGVEEYHNTLKVSFNSKNVINVYDYHEEEDIGSMSLEVGGFNLRDVINFVLGKQKYVCERNPRINDIITSQWGGVDAISTMKIDLIRGLANGVMDMHMNGVVHRSLEPESVEIVVGDDSNSLIPKFKNFVVSMTLGNQTFKKPNCYRGSFPWQAPEQILKEEESYSVDCYYLGCLIHYVVFGSHPFKEKEKMMHGNLQYPYPATTVRDEHREVWDLISRLMRRKACDRLSALKVHQHPLFWDVPRRMGFIRVVEEATTSKPNMGAYFQSITNGTIIYNPVLDAGVQNWKELLHQSFQDFLYDLSQRRDFRKVKYGNSARDLLRLIRNIMSHPLPPELQPILVSNPYGIHAYFCGKFPTIVIEMYQAIQRVKDYKNVDAFQEYF